MINYEKIKTGKNLTKNQKRLYEIYKKSILFNEKILTREDYKNNYIEKLQHRKLVDELGYVGNIKSSCYINRIKIYFCNEIKKYYVDYNYIYNRGYSGKYAKYIKKNVDINIYLGRENIKRYLQHKVGIIDGLLTLYNGKNTEIINITLNNYRKEKFTIGRVKTYIKKCIIDKNIYYSHGNTLEQAKQDLLSKIQPILKEKKKNKILQKINFNTKIGIDLYRFITGACRAGCENFANLHNLDFNLKIKVSDLLKILDLNDFGYSKLYNVVIQPLICDNKYPLFNKIRIHKGDKNE